MGLMDSFPYLAQRRSRAEECRAYARRHLGEFVPLFYQQLQRCSPETWQVFAEALQAHGHDEALLTRVLVSAMDLLVELSGLEPRPSSTAGTHNHFLSLPHVLSFLSLLSIHMHAYILK